VWSTPNWVYWAPNVHEISTFNDLDVYQQNLLEFLYCKWRACYSAQLFLCLVSGQSIFTTRFMKSVKPSLFEHWINFSMAQSSQVRRALQKLCLHYGCLASWFQSCPHLQALHVINSEKFPKCIWRASYMHECSSYKTGGIICKETFPTFRCKFPPLFKGSMKTVLPPTPHPCLQIYMCLGSRWSLLPCVLKWGKHTNEPH
jgi:hypothetical protein